MTLLQKPSLKFKMALGSEWSVLSAEEKADLDRNVICKNYSVGDSIFCEGDVCNGIYIVNSGLIAERKNGSEGGHVLIRLSHYGDTLGYRALLAGESFHADAEVIRPATVYFLPKAIMRRLLIGNTKLGARFLQSMARALGNADERFFAAVTLPARERLIHLLMNLHEHFGCKNENGSFHLDLQLNRGDIASMIGIRAESLSRLIRSIEDEGLANFSGKKITITNPEALFGSLKTNHSQQSLR